MSKEGFEINIPNIFGKEENNLKTERTVTYTITPTQIKEAFGIEGTIQHIELVQVRDKNNRVIADKTSRGIKVKVKE